MRLVSVGRTWSQHSTLWLVFADNRVDGVPLCRAGVVIEPEVRDVVSERECESTL